MVCQASCSSQELFVVKTNVVENKSSSLCGNEHFLEGVLIELVEMGKGVDFLVEEDVEVPLETKVLQHIPDSFEIFKFEILLDFKHLVD